MTNLERDSWFNTGSMVLLVFVSPVWKGPNLKVRSVHAVLLFTIFLLVRVAYARFTRPAVERSNPENKDRH